MNLLIVTQKVDKNDPILGFFHRWLIEFAKNCEKLTVICLFEGKHDLPKNVKVLSLGKELTTNEVGLPLACLPTRQGSPTSSLVIPAKAGIHGFFSKILFKIKLVFKFYKYIWSERKNYDTVFVHMNPIYFVLGGLFWKLQGKKTSLWYTHRNVDWKLKIAEKFTNIIFTASKESFQLKSDKVKVMGHGIPIEDFKNPLVIAGATLFDSSNKKYSGSRAKQSSELSWMSDGTLKIISVGRITPIKNLDTLIEASNILKNKGVDFEITLVGGTINEGDEKYLKKLKEMIEKFDLNKEIIFAGSMTNDEVKKYYWANDLSINLCPTGGVDKAILESMASGMPVLASNEAFRGYFGKYTDDLLFKERDAEDLSNKIFALAKSDKIGEIRSYLVEQVKKTSGLSNLIKNIISSLSFPT